MSASAASVVGYAQLGPTFHTVRALTLASTGAALAVFGAAWDPRLMWLLVGLAAVAMVDALYRRRRPDTSPKPRLLLEAFIILFAALLIGGPALVAAPMAYILTAALLILPLRKALLVVSFFTACVVAVYFSAIPEVEGDTQWALGLGALSVFLAALGVLLASAVRTVQQMRRREAALLEEARRANEAKTELLASVSHELRTPLASVIGFAELLRDDAAHLDETDRRRAVQSIAEQAFDIAALIDDLLVAARSEIGELKVSRVRTNLRAQAAQVLENWDARSGLRVELSGESPPVLADPGRVRQILRNLISNALRYGGPRIRVVFSASPTAGTVQVRDDGSGIPPEPAARLFDRYQRSDHPSSIGLGLAVSRDLARLMAGELTYRYDAETIFELTLPVADAVSVVEREAG